MASPQPRRSTSPDAATASLPAGSHPRARPRSTAPPMTSDAASSPLRARAGNGPQPHGTSTERLHVSPTEIIPPRLPPDPFVAATYGSIPLPEMRPSALDRTPSRSAPMPPSPPRTTPALPLVANSLLLGNSAGLPSTSRLTSAYYVDLLSGTASNGAPAATAQPRPPPAEVCVECMMRDRDMIDVDVTTPGVWARESDVDFIDALRAEEALDASQDEQNSAMLGTSAERRASLSSSRWGGTTDESVSAAHWPASSSRESIHQYGNADRRHRHRPRLGRGHLVTQASLKLWTSMNPPASSHRWRTLQTYLHEQDRILRIEKAGLEAAELERERSDQLIRDQKHALASSTVSSKKSTSPRTSGLLLSSGMTLERVDVDADEREARKRQRQSRRASNASRRDSTNLLQRTDDPISQLDGESLRRYSTPLLSAGEVSYAHRAGFRSSTDLRSMPRSPSPGRSSIAYSDRPRSSFWPARSGGGGLAPGHRSASASVFSFAPSGSMLDMHLGLSMDKHLPRVPSSRSMDESASPHATVKPKKRGGIGKFLGKLTLSPRPSMAVPEPVKSAPTFTTSTADSYFDEPLEPPNPSYLAERRRPSSGSLPSSPLPNLTPQSSYTNLSASRPTLDSQPATVDWLLAQSGSDTASIGLQREKSLPALPIEQVIDDSGIAVVDRIDLHEDEFIRPPPLLHARSDDTQSLRKVRSRQSRGILSAFGGKRQSKLPAHDGRAFEGIVRDSPLVALRYPSSR